MCIRDSFEGTTANRALGAWMRAYRPYKHEKVMPWWDGRARYADSLVVTVDRFRQGMWDYHSDALARAEKIGLSGGHEYAWGYRPRVKGFDELGLRVFGSSNVQMVTGCVRSASPSPCWRSGAQSRSGEELEVSGELVQH